MNPPQKPLTWLEINRQALFYNLRQFRKILARNVQLMAILKSNAYGHGLGLVAREIESKVDWFGVVNLEEALELRRIGPRKPILVLSYYSNETAKIKEAILKNIRLVICDLAQAKWLDQLAHKLNQKIKIHLKIDTGTSRLGILAPEAVNFLQKIRQFRQLEIEGIFSHFAASEEDQEYTLRQLQSFNKVIGALVNCGPKIFFRHFACTAAMLTRMASHFNLVRVGIGLYGLWPSRETQKLTLKIFSKFTLKPVLSWRTKIIQIKILAPGTFVGYGCTYQAQRKTRLAVLPVGYAEGYDRHLSGISEVIIRGKRAKILGRICMNLCMIDITNIPRVGVGEVVTLIGQDGCQEITVDELATKIGTINYEVVTRINPLVPRVII